MEFVKVERNDLIKQLKDYIDLLKQCPKNMEFHTLIEFCGIDNKFLDIARVYHEKNMKKEALLRQEQRQKETEGNI